MPLEMRTMDDCCHSKEPWDIFSLSLSILEEGRASSSCFMFPISDFAVPRVVIVEGLYGDMSINT